jgi:hypothetical protein
MKISKRRLKALILEELELFLEESKPNCIPGAPYHDEDGLLVEPTDAKGSWSIAKDGPHSADCKSGQGRRVSANRSVAITKRPCGRGPGGRGKAKWKCKDGTRSHTPSADLDEDVLIDEEKPAVGADTCSVCWQRFLIALNQAHVAMKGDLGKKNDG